MLIEGEAHGLKFKFPENARVSEEKISYRTLSSFPIHIPQFDYLRGNEKVLNREKWFRNRFPELAFYSHIQLRRFYFIDPPAHVLIYFYVTHIEVACGVYWSRDKAEVKVAI